MLPKDPRLVYLGIDEASQSIEPLDLDQSYADIPRQSPDFRALNLIAQGFPWSREVYAVALDKLIQAGASLVIFDLLFTTPGPGDRSFQGALERYGDRVIVGSNFSRESELNDERIRWTLSVPTAGLIPQTTPMDSRVAFVNYFPTLYDGVVRAARFQLWELQLNGYPKKASDQIFLSLAASAVTKVGEGSKIPPGFDETAIRFAGPPGTFSAKPVFEIFVPSFWKSNYGSGEFFRGKIVMIGPAAVRFHDEVDTPFGTALKMPGPELHLQVINAALQSGYLHESPGWYERLALAVAAGSVVAASFLSASPLRRFALVIGTGVIAILAAYLAYDHFSLHLATANPLVCLGVCGLGAFVVDFTAEQLERARTRREFEQYMSANVVRAVLDDPTYARDVARGIRKPVTILFSDIRGFTTLTESSDSAALVTQLNEYLGEMVRCVFRFNGTLDKFVGDAVMAVWGNTPVTKGPAGDARDAVRAALEMLHALGVLNAKWRTEGRPELQIGIGINHGEVIVANMGSSQKKELTVIGDAVNTASRFEGLTKEYGLDLLIGEAVASLVGDVFFLQDVGFNMPKGKTVPVQLFTVHGERTGPEHELPRGLAEYAEGLKRYRSHNAAGAIVVFGQAAALRPRDPLVLRYTELARQRLAEGPDAQWDDIVIMTKK